MRPFFPYYGSKWELARKGAYPEPLHARVIEPFAGGAGYSHHHPELAVLLVDKNPVVIGVWRWLIAATEAEVLGLPSCPFEAAELPPGPARDLVGLWLARGRATAAKTPTSWLRSRLYMNRFWGPRTQERIVGQLERIRHWRVLEDSYEVLPCDWEATWFVDPPYSGRPGRLYRRYGSLHLDYQQLGRWCRSRRGQVIVTEGASATWLPFKAIPFIKTLSRSRTHPKDAEAVWVSGGRP